MLALEIILNTQISLEVTFEAELDRPEVGSNLSFVLSSRLASSLSDLYSPDSALSSPPSSSSVSLSPSPASLGPPLLCRYGNSYHSMQHEVNNNNSGGGGGLYGGSAPPPVLGGRPGPSGRYLSRSIPVSQPRPLAARWPPPPSPWCDIIN